jgi:hypothetical protein
VALSNDTSYDTSSQYRGEGPVAGSSTKFVGFYYDVQSTGHGPRNATAVQTQGAYIINQGGG